jgi:hypothetical protein
MPGSASADAGLVHNTYRAERRAERQQQIDAMSSGATRVDVLRVVVEIAELETREYNGAFVRMQYFGYPRREPDALARHFG